MSSPLDKFKPILDQARELQKQHIANIFANGFKLPKETCDKYAQEYAKWSDHPNDSAAKTYAYLYAEFWSEVDRQVSVPEELNALDRATLFGEICKGTRLYNGALVHQGPETLQ